MKFFGDQMHQAVLFRDTAAGVEEVHFILLWSDFINCVCVCVCVCVEKEDPEYEMNKSLMCNRKFDNLC